MTLIKLGNQSLSGVLSKKLKDAALRESARHGDELSLEISQALPDAQTRIIKRTSGTTLQVAANNLKARELGSLSETRDQPLSKIIDQLRS